MARMSYFVVLAFSRDEDGHLLAAEPIAPPTRTDARRTAERLSTTCAGVIAFSRSGDPDLGDWADAKIIARYGEIPEGVGADEGTEEMPGGMLYEGVVFPSATHDDAVNGAH